MSWFKIDKRDLDNVLHKLMAVECGDVSNVTKSVKRVRTLLTSSSFESTPPDVPPARHIRCVVCGYNLTLEETKPSWDDHLEEFYEYVNPCPICIANGKVAHANKQVCDAIQGKRGDENA